MAAFLHPSPDEYRYTYAHVLSEVVALRALGTDYAIMRRDARHTLQAHIDGLRAYCDKLERATKSAERIERVGGQVGHDLGLDGMRDDAEDARDNVVYAEETMKKMRKDESAVATAVKETLDKWYTFEKAVKRTGVADSLQLPIGVPRPDEHRLSMPTYSTPILLIYDDSVGSVDELTNARTIVEWQRIPYFVYEKISDPCPAVLGPDFPTELEETHRMALRLLHPSNHFENTARVVLIFPPGSNRKRSVLFLYSDAVAAYAAIQTAKTKKIKLDSVAFDNLPYTSAIKTLAQYGYDVLPNGDKEEAQLSRRVELTKLLRLGTVIRETASMVLKRAENKTLDIAASRVKELFDDIRVVGTVWPVGYVLPVKVEQLPAGLERELQKQPSNKTLYFLLCVVALVLLWFCYVGPSNTIAAQEKGLNPFYSSRIGECYDMLVQFFSAFFGALMGPN